MKLFAAFTLVALAGCAGVASTNSNEITVSAQHLSKTCQPGALDDRVTISIKNGGSAPVAFPVSDTAGPPFNLYGANYTVLARETNTQEFKPWRLVLEEFEAPEHNVVLHSGDSTDFLIPLNPWEPVDLTKSYAVQVTDSSWRHYVSAPFNLCVPR